MAYKFLLSDESVNSYGTRILTEGIGLDDYLKNPIVLWGHIRSWSDKEDQILPIGKIVKLWIEDKKLYGEIVFDAKDEFAQKIESKVKQGILNACSVSINVTTTSDDSSVILQGQRYATIIECSLREVSIVDIPANKNCVRLFDSGTGRELNFSEGQECFLLPLLKPEKMNFKDDVIAALELKDTNEQAVVAEVVRLKAAEKENVSLKEENTSLKGKLQTYLDKEVQEQKDAIATLVDNAVKARKITESDKADYIALAEKDFERTKKVLDALSGVTEPDAVNHSESDPWGSRFAEIRQRTAAGK